MALSVIVSPPAESDISSATLLIADVIDGNMIAAQYDDGPLVELVHDGNSFMPRFAASEVAAITGGFRYSVRRLGGWLGRKVTLKYYEDTGSGGSLAAPIVDTEQSSNSSGDEVVALQLPFDSALCAVLMVVKLAILGGSASGTATFRAYVGGAKAALDTAYVGGGTFVGQITTSASLQLLRLTGSAVANPGTITYLTVTYESSGAGIDVTKYGLTGVVE